MNLRPSSLSDAALDGGASAHPDELCLPDPVQRSLLAVARHRRLERGEALFLKGSAPDSLFGVVQGSLRVSVAAASGREAVITQLEPGHWFGEVSLLVGQERVYDAVAVLPSDIAVVSAPDFHALVGTRPDVLMAFTRLVCHRLRHALAWIDDAILMPLPVRLARRLLALNAPALGASAEARGHGVTQEDLAFMLGVSRQSVNRQLKAWVEDGTLSLTYRRIQVLDRARLAAHAASPG